MRNMLKIKLVRNIYSSYINFFVIPFILIMFSSTYIITNSYKSDIEALKTTYAENLKTNIDMQLSEINLISNSLSNNFDVYDFSVKSSQHDYTDFIYAAKKAISAINLYSKYKTSYYTVLLYYPSQDCILSNSVMYSTKEFYNTYCTSSDIGFDTILNFLNTYEENIISLHGNDNAAMFVKPLFSKSNKHNVKMIALLNFSNMIDAHKILNSHITLNSDIKESYVLIADANKKLLYNSNDLPEKINLDTFPFSSTNKSVRLNKNYFALCQHSNIYPISYVCVFPYKYTSNNFNYLRLIISAILILVGIIYLFIAYKFSIKIFSPFRVLIDANEHEDAVLYKIEDFSQIQNLLLDLTNSNKNLNDLVQKQQASIKQNLFLQLLQNSYELNDASLNMLFDCDGIDFPYANYQIVVIRPYTNGSDQASVVYLALLAAISKLYETEPMTHTTIPTLSSNIVILFNHDYDEHFLVSHLNAIIMSLDMTETPISIGVGRIIKTLKQTSKSYEDALCSSMTTNKNCCNYYSSANKTAAIDSYFSKEDYQKLQKELVNGNVFNVSEFFDAFITRLFENNTLTSNMYAYLCFSLTDLLENSITMLKIHSDETDKHIERCRQIISNNDYLNNINIIKDSYISICNHIQSRKLRSNVSLLENITNYINENYADPNISLKQVSEEMYVSYNYLCKFYREQTGMVFLDSLHALRVEKSKKLLEDYNNSINSIAKSVGYLSPNSYIRKFKQITGITPGEYRKFKQK